MSGSLTTTESDGLDTNRSTTSSLSDKMVADEEDCSLSRCGGNRRCVQTEGGPVCVCPEGHAGDGLTCTEMEPVPPVVNNTTPGHNNVVETCPSSHDSYCLYQGVCFYFPEMKSYACNCVSGYMGERCQFSDLEWWELQQEEQKKKNVTIAACMVGLLSLLAIAACVTYCYGTRRLFDKKRPDDSVSEISVTVENTPETTTSTVPPFSLRAETTGRPRRAVCPSCSSESGDGSDGPETSAKHDGGYGSSVAVETEHPPVRPPSPVWTFTTFKPHQRRPRSQEVSAS